MTRIALAVLFLLLCTGYVVSIEARLDRIRTVVEVGDVVTTWISGGIQREVRTTQNPGETLAQWQERHFATVVEKQTEFPPDAP